MVEGEFEAEHNLTPIVVDSPLQPMSRLATGSWPDNVARSGFHLWKGSITNTLFTPMILMPLLG